MLWTWIAVAAAGWLVVAVVVSLILARAVRLRDEREPPAPRGEHQAASSSKHYDRADGV